MCAISNYFEMIEVTKGNIKIDFHNICGSKPKQSKYNPYCLLLVHIGTYQVKGAPLIYH